MCDLSASFKIFDLLSLLLKSEPGGAVLIFGCLHNWGKFANQEFFRRRRSLDALQIGLALNSWYLCVRLHEQRNSFWEVVRWNLGILVLLTSHYPVETLRELIKRQSIDGAFVNHLHIFRSKYIASIIKLGHFKMWPLHVVVILKRSELAKSFLPALISN